MGAFVLFVLLVVFPVLFVLRLAKRKAPNPYIKEHKKREESRSKYVEYLNWLRKESPEEIPLPESMDDIEAERRFEMFKRESFFRKLFK